MKEQVQEIMNQAEEAAVIETSSDASNEIAVSGVYEKMNIAKDIASGGRGYCSMTAADDKAKVTLYNACSNPSRLSDMVNKRIKMLHVYAEVIQIVNEKSGELVSVPRVIIIDEQGKGYQAVSVGIYNAVKRIISMFGEPDTWDRPHTVEVQNVNLKDGQHTFNLIMVD